MSHSSEVIIKYPLIDGLPGLVLRVSCGFSPLPLSHPSGQNHNFFFLIIYLFIFGCVGSSFLCEGFL